MKHQGFLDYKHFRFLKVAVWSALIAGTAYAWHRMFYFRTPGGVGYGGTWPGYAFGTAAALLIFWLIWLGVRKRQYHHATPTKVWLSAHVYLGVLALVLATLHSGFELGLNLHSLVYLLMWIVVGSGIYGVVVFSRVPQRLTEAMGEDTLASLVLQLGDVDVQARALALSLPDRYNGLVADAAQDTRLQASVLNYLFRKESRNCPTAKAVMEIETLNLNLPAEQTRPARELFALLLRRQGLVDRIRVINRLMVQMRFWLVLHVPPAVALVAALTAHIVSVFIYW